MATPGLPFEKFFTDLFEIDFVSPLVSEDSSNTIMIALGTVILATYIMVNQLVGVLN